MSIVAGINFPLEIGTIDADCTICHEELQWPIFCSRCKQGNCFQCLDEWFRHKNECPTCRNVFHLAGDNGLRTKYGCPRDGNLVEFYCEQCLDCFCGACRVNSGSVHFRHHVRTVDALRKDIIDTINSLAKKKHNTEDAIGKALGKLKTLMPTGSPFELVRQRRVFQSELDRLKPVASPTGVFEQKCLCTNVHEELQTFSATDHSGNVWELRVHPKGFSGAQGMFLSVYLKLVRGQPGRYEYQFKILDKNGLKPVEVYSAVDDFTCGGLSLACQRLIHLNEARQQCFTAKGYNLAFTVKPTNPKYAAECATALSQNKALRLDYKTYTWTVRNFSAKKAANKIEFSPVMFDQQKISWRFRIDCNGHFEQGTHISVFLELLNGAEGWFDVFIRMFHPTNPAVEYKRELTHKFTVHSNWGVPHFMSHSDLYRYLNNDELRFEYGVRPAYTDREL